MRTFTQMGVSKACYLGGSPHLSSWVAVVVAITISLTSLTVGPAAATVYRWTKTSAAGPGQWNDPMGWSPRGVPGADDTADITSPGSYTIEVTSNEVIRNLNVGQSDTALLGVKLIVMATGWLTVTNYSVIYVPSVTVSGSLDVGTMAWYGEKLEGVSTSGEAGKRGMVTVQEMLVVAHGSSSRRKQLINIQLTVMKNMMLDSTMDVSGAQLICNRCLVTNMPGSDIVTGKTAWLLDPSFSALVGRDGLVNNGTVSMELLGNVQFGWPVVNRGRFLVVTIMWHARYRVDLLENAQWILTGDLAIYQSILEIRSNSQLAGNGMISLATPAALPNPPSRNNKRGILETYIKEVFPDGTEQGLIFNDVRYVAELNLYRAHNTTIDISRITGNGVQISVTNTNNLRFNIRYHVQIGKGALLSLQAGMNNSFSFLEGSQFALGRIVLQSGWQLNFGSSAQGSIHGYVWMGERAVMVCGPLCRMWLLNDFSCAKQSRLVFINSTVGTIGMVSVSGSLILNYSTLSVYGSLHWGEGSLVGPQGNLLLHGSSWFAPRLYIAIDNVHIDVKATTLPRLFQSGVIYAEYFQHRISTESTDVIHYLRYFPGEAGTHLSAHTLPAAFDNSSAQPTISRIEVGLERPSVLNGLGPIQYSDGLYVNNTSPHSFTYNYAARLWFFIHISNNSNYTFYCNYGPSMKIRLWVDDQPLAILPFRYIQTFAPPDQPTRAVLLTAGFHRIRLDYIVQSSWWNTAQWLSLSYSGPGMPKHIVPESQIFLHRALPTGETEFVNPNANKIAQGKMSYLCLDSAGLLLGKNMPALNVGQTGVVDITKSLILASLDTFELANAGQLRQAAAVDRSTLYVNYVNQGGTIDGSIVLRDFKADGGLAVWQSASSGSWQDSKNWIHGRLPQATDKVYITASGSYEVLIQSGSNIVIDSLVVGDSLSNPQLIVGHSSNLTIRDRLEIYTRTIEINGQVTADRVYWKGERISSNGFRSSLLAKSLLVVQPTSFSSNILSNIILENHGNATVEGSGKSLSCVSCQIVNSYGAIFVTQRRYYAIEESCTVISSIACLRSGFVNDGHLVMEMKDYTLDWRLPLYNNGKVTIVNKLPFATRNCYLRAPIYGEIGTIRIFMVQVNVEGNYQNGEARLGLVDVYNWPGINGTMSAVTGSNRYGQWEEYTERIEQLHSEVGDDTQNGLSGALFLRNIYGSPERMLKVTIQQLKGTGSGQFVINSHYANISILAGIDAPDKNFHVVLADSYWVNSQGNQLCIHNGQVAVGKLFVGLGWNVRLLNNYTARFTQGVQVASNGALDFGTDCEINVLGPLIVAPSANLSIASGNLYVHGDFVHFGHSNFGKSSVLVQGQVRFTAGQWIGHGGSFTLQGGWLVSGVEDKILEGLNLRLSGPSKLLDSSQQNGMLVEFFQYRVNNALHQAASYLNFPGESYKALPDSFEEPTTLANTVRVLLSLHSPPVNEGHDHKDYHVPTGNQISKPFAVDLSSVNTFVYNYAARGWFYLQVGQEGDYQFYIQSGRAIRPRLSINSTVLIHGSFYRDYYKSPEIPSAVINLVRGYHRIRLDYIVQNSQWQTRNGLTVLWSGPGFQKRIIPPQAIFYKLGRNNYAQPAFHVLSNSSFSRWLSEYDAKISGPGMVIAYQSVTVEIAEWAVADIQSPFEWRCISSLSCSIENSGLIRRSGTPGPSVVYAQYLTGKGLVNEQVPSLHIQQPSNATNFISWSNPKGGLWSDPTNWAENRVPSSGDLVYIIFPGVYDVVIPTGVTVNISNLVVGAPRSSPHLLVGALSKLIVVDELAYESSWFTIEGSVIAGEFIWIGETLAGSALPGLRGELTAQRSFVVRLLSYSRRYINHLTIFNLGWMTLENSLATSTWLTCSQCSLINLKGATMVLSWRYLEAGEAPTDNMLVNYGDVVINTRNHYRQVNIDWSLTNYHRIVAFTSSTQDQVLQLRINGRLDNQGIIRTYMTQIQLYQYSAPLPLASGPLLVGEWEVFDYPASTATPVRLLTVMEWEKFIHDAYMQTPYFRLSPAVQLSLLGVNNRIVNFRRLTTFGRVIIWLNRGRNTTFAVDELNMDANSEMRSSSGTYESRFLAGNSADNNITQAFGIISLTGNYNFSVVGAHAKFLSKVSLQNSKLDLQVREHLVFHAPVLLDAGCHMLINRSFAVFDDRLSLSGGHLQLYHGQADIRSYTVDWGSSTISGPGLMSVRREAIMGSGNSKILQDVNISITPLPVTSLSSYPVVAEYFQYRVQTDTTPRLYRIESFPSNSKASSYSLPQNFNDPHTVPNVVRLERSLHSWPQTEGQGPRNLNRLDGFMAHSSQFTYNYAARLWSHLMVRKEGNYSFFISSGTHTVARLWIDNQVLFTSQVSQPNAADEEIVPSIFLSAGWHQIRLDYFINTGYQLLGNSLALKWSGPGFAKQLIPKRALAAFLQNGTQWLSASPAIAVDPSLQVCNTSSRAQAQTEQLSLSRLVVSSKSFSAIGTPVLEIAAQAILDVHSSSSWPLASNGDRLHLILKGLVNKTGGSSAITLNTLYKKENSACMNTPSGILDLGIPLVAKPTTISPTTVTTSSNSTTPPPGDDIYWSSSSSGNWSDPSKWTPRIPAANDNVFILQAGVRIYIRSDTIVANLTVGMAHNRNVGLIIPFGTLTVSDTATIDSAEFGLQGRLVVGTLNWSGASIRKINSAAVSSAHFGTLVILRAASIRQGLHRFKFFEGVSLINYAFLEIDDDLRGDELSCTDCHIINERNATILLPSMTLGTTQYSPGHVHLQNKGQLISADASGSLTIHWAVENVGRMVFLSMNSAQRRLSRFVSPLTKIGNILLVFTTVEISGKYPGGAENRQINGQGSFIEVFGQPLADAGEPALRIDEKAQWQAFLNRFRSNLSSIYWRTDMAVDLHFLNMHGDQLELPSVSTHGFVRVRFTASDSVTARLTVQQDEVGVIDLLSAPASARSLLLLTSSNVGAIFSGSGWSITASGGTTFQEGIHLGRNSSLTVNVNTNSTLNTSQYTFPNVVIGSLAVLNVSGDFNDVTFKGLDVYGTVRFTSAYQHVNVSASEIFRLQGSIIIPNNGTVKLLRQCNITGDTTKLLDNTDLAIELPWQPTHGIIAQYFQHRISTATTVAMNIRGFPAAGRTPAMGFLPSEFDNISAVPTFQRVEVFLGQQTSSLGHAPLLYQSDARKIDLSHLSFTRNYAVRQLTNILIERDGLYQFFFRYRTGPGRLWIDGRIVLTIPQSGYRDLERNVLVNLASGLHSIRLDFIRPSQSQAYDVFQVLYSGPGIPKQSIPRKVFFLDRGPKTNGLSLASLVVINLPACFLGGDPLLSVRGSSIVVDKSRELNIHSTFQWLSSFGDRQVVLINKGILRKTGGGVATIYAKYYPGTLAHIERVSGSIDFRNLTAGDGTIRWVNRNGGIWTEPLNWYPPQIPRANNIVFIDAPGSFHVVIPAGVHVEVNSVHVGGPYTNAHLLVEAFATLNVRDGLHLLSGVSTIAGTVFSQNVFWSGASLRGKAMSASRGSLIVEKLFSLIASPSFLTTEHTSREFDSLNIINNGQFLYPILSSFSNSLACQNCELINNGQMTLHSTSLVSAGASTSSLKNNGNLTWVLASNSWRHQSVTASWAVINVGHITIANTDYSSSKSVRFDYPLINRGSVTAYMVSVTVGRAHQTFDSSYSILGDWYLWGKPVLNSSRGQLPSFSDVGLSSVLSFLYKEPIYWNTDTSFSVNFLGTYQAPLKLTTLEVKGRVIVVLPNATVIVSGQMRIQRAGTLQFSTKSKNKLLLNSTGEQASTLGNVISAEGWIIHYLSDAPLHVLGQLEMTQGSKMFIAPGTGAIHFENVLLLKHSAALMIHGRQVRFWRMFVQGSLELQNSSAIASNQLQWYAGELLGTNSSLILRSGFVVSGSFRKTLDGLEVHVWKESEPSSQGVIAEYFQYRVDNPIVPKLSYLRFCSVSCSPCVGCVLPKVVNASNVMQIEPDISRRAVSRTGGHAPIEYESDTLTINYSSPQTFNGHYAVRWSTFLIVDQPGEYIFFIYALFSATRIWINGEHLWTEYQQYSSEFRNIETPTVQLKAGANLLQVDNIVYSSQLRSSLFLVEYKGPNVTRQVIPSSRLRYSIIDPIGQTVYASLRWDATAPVVSTLRQTSVDVLNNQALLSFSHSSVLNIKANIRWLSLQSPTNSLIVNSGRIRTLPKGISAVFGARLQNQNGSVEGDVQFSNQTEASAVMWNNPSGGYWLDASNWMPPRLPGPDDAVLITLQGSYQVILAGGHVTVRHLEVSGNAELIIWRLSFLNITNLWHHRAETLSLQSSVVAQHFYWYGRSITATVRDTELAVLSYLEIGSRSSTLTNVTLISDGKCVVKPGDTFSCEWCQIVFAKNSTALFTRSIYRHESARASLNFSTGLINHGLLVWAAPQGISRTTIQHNLVNHGQAVFLSSYSFTNSLFTFTNAAIRNHGRMLFYSVSVYFDYMLSVSGGNGEWQFWGIPYRPASFGHIKGLGVPERWKDILDSLYYLPEHDHNGLSSPERLLWSTDRVPKVRISQARDVLSPVLYEIGSLQTYGYFDVDVGAANLITIHRSLLLSRDTTLLLAASQHVSRLQFLPSCKIEVGMFKSSGTWRVSIAPQCTWHSFHDFVFNSHFEGNYGTMLIAGTTHIGSKAAFVLHNSTMHAAEMLHLSGHLTLDHSVANVSGLIRWSNGTIDGTIDSVITIHKGGTLTGAEQLTFDSIQLSLRGAHRTDDHGIIAEYFQYRVATPTTPALSSLLLFPRGVTSVNSYTLPNSFDDVHFAANFMRVEPSLSRAPQRFGSGPLVYQDNGQISTGAESFTYNYAVRYSTFMFVSQAGYYEFFLATVQSTKRVRLWVNDIEKWRGVVQRYPANTTVVAKLERGYNKLRLDVMNGYRDRQDYGLLITYQGGCTGLQSLSSNLFVRAIWNGTMQYAAPTYTRLGNHSVCDSSLQVSDLCQLFEGVSCLQVNNPAGLLVKGSPFLSIFPNGIVYFKSQIWPVRNVTGKLVVFLAGAVARVSAAQTINLGGIYADVGGCHLSGGVTLGTQDRTVAPPPIISEVFPFLPEKPLQHQPLPQNCTVLEDTCFPSIISCSAGGVCVRQGLVYRCSCMDGYASVNGICLDVDECSLSISPCGDANTTRCHNIPGSYICGCRNGFSLRDMESARCHDEDECKLNFNQCDLRKSKCVNTYGSFVCVCNSGYIHNGEICEDINECLVGICIDHRNCSSTKNACNTTTSFCENTDGSYNCHCKSGFAHKSHLLDDDFAMQSYNTAEPCEDVDECTSWYGSPPCDLKVANCTNTFGGFNCTCHSSKSSCSLKPQCGIGYVFSNGSCVDEDECQRPLPVCNITVSRCRNTEGSYSCTCLPGYFPDYKAIAAGPTDAAYYSDSLSSNGLQVESAACQDIDECAIANLHIHGIRLCNATVGRCVNTPGSYQCVCLSGFVSRPISLEQGTDSPIPLVRPTMQCVDADECIRRQHNCHRFANCMNVWGSFHCSCRRGFIGNGINCRDVNECNLNENRNPCGDQQCFNSIGSYICRPLKCLAGFELVGSQCQPKPIDCSVCHQDATCSAKHVPKADDDQLAPLTAVCTCKPGLTGNGFACTDYDECSDVNQCPKNSLCHNSYGSFSCNCAPGYIGNKTFCHAPVKVNLRPKEFFLVRVPAELVCNASGDPPPTSFMWWQGQDFLIEQGNRPLLSSRKKLTIPYPTDVESGWYTCFARGMVTSSVGAIQVVFSSESNYKMELRIAGKEYTADLQQPQSESYKNLVKVISSKLSAIFDKDPKFATLLNITDVSFQSGSIVASWILHVVHEGNASADMANSLTSRLQLMIQNGAFLPELTIDVSSIGIAPAVNLTVALEDAIKMPINTTSAAAKVATNVQALTSVASNLSVSQINSTVAVLTKVTTASRPGDKQYGQVANKILSIADNLLDVPASTLATAQSATNSSAIVVEFLESTASQRPIIMQTGTVGSAPYETITVPRISQTIADYPPEGVPTTFSLLPNRTTNSGIVPSSLSPKDVQLQENNNLKSVIQGAPVAAFLPASTIQNAACKDASSQNCSRRVQFNVYTSGLFFQEIQSEDKEGLGRTIGTSGLANSLIIGIKVGNRSRTNLKDPLVLAFKPLLGAPTRQECVFWNYTLYNGHGGWSKDGCVRQTTTDSHIFCACDHLTNFALLLAPEGDDSEALKLVSIVGCSLSVFGLILTIAFFLAVREVRQGNQGKIIVSISLSLLILLLLFLTGIERTESKDSCRAVALLIHYFLLCTFFWMTSEAYHLYLLLIKVFHHVHNLLPKLAIVSHGVPLLIVVITAAVDWDVYSNEKFCRMTYGTTFYISVILPLAVTLLINVVIFALVQRELSRRRKTTTNTSERQLKRRRLFASISLCVTLGLTWILGLTVLENAHAAPQWLFAICASLQGFFIFLFQVVNHKIFKEKILKGKIHPRMPDTQLSLSSSTSTAKSYTGRRRTTMLTIVNTLLRRTSKDSTSATSPSCESMELSNRTSQGSLAVSSRFSSEENIYTADPTEWKAPRPLKHSLSETNPTGTPEKPTYAQRVLIAREKKAKEAGKGMLGPTSKTPISSSLTESTSSLSSLTPESDKTCPKTDSIVFNLACEGEALATISESTAGLGQHDGESQEDGVKPGKKIDSSSQQKRETDRRDPEQCLTIANDSNVNACADSEDDAFW